MKILGGIVGVIVGYIAWQIVKYALLLAGPFLLMPMGISGPRAAANLESIAEIVGFVVFVFVVRKIYRLMAKKGVKQKNTETISQDLQQ